MVDDQNQVSEQEEISEDSKKCLHFCIIIVCVLFDDTEACNLHT